MLLKRWVRRWIRPSPAVGKFTPGAAGGTGRGGLAGSVGVGGGQVNIAQAYAEIRAEEERTARTRQAAWSREAMQRDRLASQSGLVAARTNREALRGERERVSLQSQRLRLTQQEATAQERSVKGRAGPGADNRCGPADDPAIPNPATHRALRGIRGTGFFGQQAFMPSQRGFGATVARGMGALGGIFGGGGGPGGGGGGFFGGGGGGGRAGVGTIAAGGLIQGLGGWGRVPGQALRGVGMGTIAMGSMLGGLGAAAITGATRAMTGLAAETFDAVAANEALNQSFQTLLARDLIRTGQAVGASQAMTMAEPLTAALREWNVKTAIQSPFAEEDVARIFQRFLTVNMPPKQAQDMTNRMVDLASAYRLSGDEMGRLAKAFGDVETRGYLTAEEVRQFVNARFDIQGAVSDVIGKTRAEVVDMQKEKKITAEMVREALTRVTTKNRSGAARRGWRSHGVAWPKPSRTYGA